MKIGHYAASAASGYEHRSGSISFETLISGEAGALDNYHLNVATLGADYNVPRHRHNFDQLRFVLEGSVSMGVAGGGHRLVIKPGEVAYFPEGTAYGPHVQTERAFLMAIQSGGASGQGFYTASEVNAGYAALRAHGTFEKGVFHQNEGATAVSHPTMDAYEAIWESLAGRPLAYPEPRFDEPILMKPENFDWLADPDAPGVERKQLGVFGERSFELTLLRFDHTTYTVPARAGRRILFVLDGSLRLDGNELSRYSAAEISTGERALLEADAATVVSVGLPIFSMIGAQRARQRA